MHAMPAPRISERRLSYEEFRALPEDGPRYELFDGELVMSPGPLDRHQRVSLNLCFLLETFLRQTRIGTMREAPSEVRLGEATVVEPDLYVVLAAHFDRFERNGLRGAPDLVIEILSRSRRSHDLVRKHALYERSGVGEYWVVDPDLDRVEIYRREPDDDGGTRFARPLVLTAALQDSLETPLLPGFTTPLAEVFDPGPEGAHREGDPVA